MRYHKLSGSPYILIDNALYNCILHGKCKTGQNVAFYPKLRVCISRGRIEGLKIGLIKLLFCLVLLRPEGLWGLSNNNFGLVSPILSDWRGYVTFDRKYCDCFEFAKKLKSWKRESKKVVKNLKHQSVLYQNNRQADTRIKNKSCLCIGAIMKNHDKNREYRNRIHGALWIKTSSEISNWVSKLP